jgi:hypothetical protein
MQFIYGSKDNSFMVLLQNEADMLQYFFYMSDLRYAIVMYLPDWVEIVDFDFLELSCILFILVNTK